MIHIIISGHGEFATGLLSGAKLLCGDIPACDAIDFSEGMSDEELRKTLQTHLDEIGANHPILFLTDILGGTPFRACSTFAGDLPNAEVITGTNLQILTEAAIERDNIDDVQSFARDLVASAKECMTLLSDKLSEQRKRTAEENDGI